MQNDFIPQELQSDFNQLLQEVEQLGQQIPTHCPYCVSKIISQTRAEQLTFRCKTCFKYFNPLTRTPFNRLLPVHWLTVILHDRVNRETYQDIADKLECDIKKIMRRDKAIKNMIELRFPALYTWYCAHNNIANQFEANSINETISAQYIAFKQKLTDILATTHANCLYCHSNKTVKVSKRASFRCNHCRRGFSLLHDTSILRLPNTNKWLAYIDLLVAKNSNQAIISQLGFNSGTATKWRRSWCATMQQWGFESLAIWCKRR